MIHHRTEYHCHLLFGELSVRTDCWRNGIIFTRAAQGKPILLYNRARIIADVRVMYKIFCPMEKAVIT